MQLGPELSRGVGNVANYGQLLLAGQALPGGRVSVEKCCRHRVHTGQSKPCALAQPSRSPLTPRWQSLATCWVAKQKCVCRVPASGSQSGVTESGFETKTNWQLH